MLFSWVHRLLRNMKTASALENKNPKTRSAPKTSQFLQESCPTTGAVPCEGKDDGPEVLPRCLPCVYVQVPTSVSPWEAAISLLEKLWAGHRGQDGKSCCLTRWGQWSALQQAKTFLVPAGSAQPASPQAEPESRAPMGDSCCMARQNTMLEPGQGVTSPALALCGSWGRKPRWMAMFKLCLQLSMFPCKRSLSLSDLSQTVLKKQRSPSNKCNHLCPTMKMKSEKRFG